MKPQCIVVLLAFFALLAGASGISCPLCEGHVVKFCNIEVYPAERMYNQEITVNVTMGFKGVFTPKSETEVEVWYYGLTGNITKLYYNTSKNGIVKFKPETVGYYLVKTVEYRTCEKSILIYVNTTCGDGICGGGETLTTCLVDCGKCGDGVCSEGEDLGCPDCAVCGDGACTAGEIRTSCLKDCVFCGDDICDYVENRSSCGDDCQSGAPDGYCDGEADGICDPDCKATEDKDCEQPKQVVVVEYEQSAPNEDNTLAYIIIILFLTVALVSLALSIVKTKPKKKRA